jgi:phage terminase small subunit
MAEDHDDGLTDEERHLSADMRACSPKERGFVDALMTLEPAHNSFAQAARRAGYGTPTSTPLVMTQIGSRLSKRPHVAAAIASEAKRHLRTLGPKAVSGLQAVMNDPNHRDFLKAIRTVLDRSDPAVQVVDVKHTHEDHDALAIEQLKTLRALGVAHAKLIDVFGSFGLERIAALARSRGEITDVEYSEVLAIEHKPDPLLDLIDGS